ncbi:putative chaperone protein [Thermochaetoides thermophila DSM 1495]|uniref:Putative chaperone protein n=1 Tax=Chaetomium thermophilum (strain DSM 1495 / CBS 144.50 / IMI 039719) TaxID=759272 RepID=G0S3H8_CHATD|nr:putative chaperone protein [Thermochaetoides thermophila DSM 1495]EGS22561.1 putative chaperone protein [Thermochaetoides thermophila DSM 1495]
MSSGLDLEKLKWVFRSRPDILTAIQQAADTPARTALFNEIADFVHQRLALADVQNEPAAKRRRVDADQPPSQPHANGHPVTGSWSAVSRGASSAGSSADVTVSEPVLLEIKDISVVVPQRKKYDICFTQSCLFAKAQGATGPAPGLVYPWIEIEHAFFLPVPDKSQTQYNYILLPRDSYLPTSKASGVSSDRQASLEPLVFTVPAAAPKAGSIKGTAAKTAEAFAESYSCLFHWALTTSLRAAGNESFQLISSDPRVFHSLVKQPHRPNEKAVHVKAFRGSKEGFLFFLPTGILWGFKKPLVFLPLDKIAAVSYTNVLRTTFNLVIELDSDVTAGGNATDKEIEFGMIDQEDYQVINENYVQRHGLADRSMAEQRRAKRQLAENLRKSTKAESSGEPSQNDGLTELERAAREAEQRLQDEEDELEEDYDPGSDGDSDGEGSSEDDEGTYDEEGCNEEELGE